MENEEVKAPKNNKGKTITIVVLILIILGLGGYIAYDKILSENDIKDSNKVVKEESKEEVKEEQKINEDDYTLKLSDGTTINLLEIKKELIEKVNSSSDIKIVLETCDNKGDNNGNPNFVTDDKELSIESINIVIEKLKTAIKVEETTSSTICPEKAFGIYKYNGSEIIENYFNFDNHNDGKNIPIGIGDKGYLFTFEDNNFNKIFDELK